MRRQVQHRARRVVRRHRISLLIALPLLALVGSVHANGMSDLPALGRRPGHVPVPGVVVPVRAGAVAVLVLLRPRAGRLDPARGVVDADRRLRPARHGDRLRQRVHADRQGGQRRPAVRAGPPAGFSRPGAAAVRAAVRAVPAGAGLQPVDVPRQPGHAVAAAGVRARVLAAAQHRRGHRRRAGVRDGRADQGDRADPAAGVRLGVRAEPGPAQPGRSWSRWPRSAACC